MPTFLQRLFSPEYLVKDKLKLGELPDTKTAYQTALSIALPSVIEMVSISLIGMADTVMVGRLGPYAISAVGLTGQPVMMVLSLFFALNIGVTAIVSRRKGANNRLGANLCLKQAVMLGSLLSCIGAVLAVIFAEPMMRLAGAQPDTIAAATGYFRIIGYAVPVRVLAIIISSAQRGIGNTKITLRVNLAANIVNVIFNFLLIEGRFGFPRLEVEGAALATAIGHVVGLVLALASVMRRDSYLSLRGREGWKPDLPVLGSIAKVGGSAVLEQIAMRIGFFIFARIIADLGTNDFASHQIGMQVMNLTFTFGDGIGVATTSLVGQNLGRQRPDISIMYGKIGQRMAMCVSAVMFFVILFGRKLLVMAFTNDPSIIAVASNLLIMQACLQPLQTSQVIMGGSLRGAGDTKFVAMTMLGAVAVCRPLFAYLFVYPIGLGVYGAWISMFIDQTIRLVLLMRRFSGGKWINIKL